MGSHLTRRSLLGAPLGLAVLGAALPVMGQDMPLIEYDVESQPGLAPLLVIYPDGKVLYRDTTGQQSEGKAPLAPEQIATMMATFTDDLRLHEISNDDLLAEIEAKEKAANALSVSPADGGTTKLVIRDTKTKVDLAIYSTGFYARAHPDIDALQRLRAAEKILLDLLLALQSG